MNVNEKFPCPDVYTVDSANSVEGLLQRRAEVVYAANSYKLPNSVRTSDAMRSLMSGFRLKTEALVSIMDEQGMYESVAGELSGNVLLPYPSVDLRLGHALQFVPLVENAIRDIGSFCGVVPYRESEASFLRGKEPRTVPTDLLGELYKEADTFEGADDLLFVYFALFSSNGFNIRNELVHGGDYQSGGSLRLAFRTMLLCLHMLLARRNRMMSSTFDER